MGAQGSARDMEAEEVEEEDKGEGWWVGVAIDGKEELGCEGW